MMKCKYCGGNLTLEQAYCPHCGRPNEEAAQHVKDMEHYKSNFEDTKSDVYEVTEKNTEIMSHMIIITVLVILCVVVFVVSARSWSIHRGLLQFDAGIRQGSYMKQMEQYLEDEDYIGLSAFCDRHYIRPYSSNNSYEKYQLLMEASGAYRYFYESLMKAVTINSDCFETCIQLLLDQFPDCIACGLDHHTSLDTGVITQLCLLHYIGIPLGEIFFHGSDRFYHFLVCHFFSPFLFLKINC